MFGIGYSWGGFESLALPVDPRRQVTKPDFGGPLVRLSIGLEDTADLIADLTQAFDRFRAARAMNGMAAWLSEMGIVTPSPRDLGLLSIATALTIAALVAGLFARRWFGPRATAQWKARVGHHAEGIGTRLGAIIDHGVSAILLAIALKGYPWPSVTDLPLGLALAISVALLASHVLRGLHLPRWMAWFVALVLFTAVLSNAIGGLAPITATFDRIGFDVGKRRFSLLALITIAVTAVGLFAGVRLINRLIAHSFSRADSLDPTQKLLGQKLAAIAVIVAAFFIGIDLLDIDLTAFAVFSGAFGLAVGFGLQKTFGNLIAGIILLLDRSIKPGDVIVIGDAVGQVNKIGVRAVSIVTRDGKEHLIPNENLMTQEVENWSYSDRNVRVRVKVGVDYGCDVLRAQELMLQAAMDSPRVLDNPKPNVWLTGFGENALQFEIRVWISDPESGLGNMTSDVLTRVWRLFKEHGIAFPYPQRDIHVRSWPDGVDAPKTIVIPAKAGIQTGDLIDQAVTAAAMDSRLRGNNEVYWFARITASAWSPRGRPGRRLPGQRRCRGWSRPCRPRSCRDRPTLERIAGSDAPAWLTVPASLRLTSCGPPNMASSVWLCTVWPATIAAPGAGGTSA